MFVLIIIGVVGFFVTACIIVHETQERLTAGLMILILVFYVMVIVSSGDHAYKDGQIDALKNNWEYERHIIKNQTTGSITTNYVKIKETE